MSSSAALSPNQIYWQTQTAVNRLPEPAYLGLDPIDDPTRNAQWPDDSQSTAELTRPNAALTYSASALGELSDTQSPRSVKLRIARR